MPDSREAAPRRRRLMLWLSGLALPLGLPPAQARSSSELLIGGTGAGVGPLQQVLAGQAALRWVPNLSTSGGLRALQAGAIDIALSARPASDAERAQGLVSAPLFRTPYVFAAHASVPVQRLSMAELAALYAGRTTHWSNGQPVRLVMRPSTDLDTTFLKSLGPAMADALALAQARPGNHVAMVDADATEALERIDGSLGLTTLGLLRAERRRLSVLALEGVRPDVDTLADRRYAHAKSVHVVTRGQPRPEVQAVLASLGERRQAQALAELGCALTGSLGG